MRTSVLVIIAVLSALIVLIRAENRKSEGEQRRIIKECHDMGGRAILQPTLGNDWALWRCEVP